MKPILRAIVPFILAPLYYLYTRTWRIEERGDPEVLRLHVQQQPQNLKPAVFAHWHGDELFLIGYYARRRLAVLSSLSEDGTLMAKVLELLGYQVFRGSSSRGGARGLIGLIRAVQKDSQAALAVDGPRGPLHVVKPGVVELALRTGAPLVPVRVRALNSWYIPRAWNKCYLPKPFSKIIVQYGQPIAMERSKKDLSNTEIQQIATATEVSLKESIPN